MALGNEASLEVIMRARDELSNVLRDAGKETENFGRKADGLGATLRRVGEIAAGFLSARVIGDMGGRVTKFFGDATAGATNLEQSLGAIDQIFEGSAETIHAWANEAAQAAGLSRNSYNELASFSGTVFKGMGLDMQAATQQTGALVQRGADLAAMFGGTASEAVTALNSAMVGNTEAVRKYGITLTAIDIQERALAETGKTKASALTQAEKQMATYSLLMERSGVAAGQFARESDTAAGAAARQAAAAENMAARVGEYLLPLQVKWREAQLALVTVVVTRVLPALERLGDFVRTVGERIAGSRPAIAGIAAVIAAALVPALIAGATAAGSFVVGMVAAAAPVIAIGAAIGGLVAAVVWLGENWDMVFSKMPEPVQNALNAVKSFAEGFVNVLQTAFNWLIDQLNKIEFDIPDWVPGVGGKHFGINIPKVEVIFGAIADVAGNVVDKVGGAVGGLKDAITGVGGAANAAAPDLGGLGDGLGGLGGGAAGAAAKVKTLADVLEQIEQDGMARRVEAFLRGGEALAAQAESQNSQMLADAQRLAIRLHHSLGIDLPSALEIAWQRVQDSAQAMADTVANIEQDGLQRRIDAFLRGGEAMAETARRQNDQMFADARALADQLAQVFGIDLPDALSIAMDHVIAKADELKRAAEEAAKARLGTVTSLANAASGTPAHLLSPMLNLYNELLAQGATNLRTSSGSDYAVVTRDGEVVGSFGNVPARFQQDITINIEDRSPSAIRNAVVLAGQELASTLSGTVR